MPPLLAYRCRLAASVTSVASLLAACNSMPLNLPGFGRQPEAAATAPDPAIAPDPAPGLPDLGAARMPGFRPGAPMAMPGGGNAGPVTHSNAATARDYRKDAASHLYARNAQRIYKGRMPPLLYAVGVLDVEVDGRGQVVNTHWKRAPSHAPEVIAEIERTVKEAAPYPVPARIGRVVYTDVWLWHKSGNFQLDTLTEGQD